MIWLLFLILELVKEDVLGGFVNPQDEVLALELKEVHAPVFSHLVLH